MGDLLIGAHVYRLRFHGRGGQGVKTASRVLGSAFFLEGFVVQDAPVYGAERRGAPVFAAVRAARSRIDERGIVRRPDLVVVADETLVPLPSAGVLAGLDARSLLLLASREPAEVWKDRLRIPGDVLCVPPPETDAAVSLAAMTGAGAAARLVGVIAPGTLERAIREELAPLGTAAVARALGAATDGWARMALHAGRVTGREEAPPLEPPEWIDLPLDEARVSAPAIHATLTSEAMPTGLWRTTRPVIHHDLCHHCWWICSTLCPDNAIVVDEPTASVHVDYDHCKGCLVCVAVCPHHAIEAVPERAAAETEREAP